jgi:DNA-binding response OmpR family regulator
MSRGKTVLLVDNDLAALTVYSEGLQREGFRIHTAEDGGEALLQLAALPIDIVVMAAALPSFTGLEVLKRMREDEVLMSVPAVILADTSTQARTDLGGINHFLLRKDASFSGLLNVIHEVMADRPEKKKAATRKANRGNSDMASSNSPTSAAVAIETLEASAESAALLKKVSSALSKIREDCLGYVKAPKTTASQQHLVSLHTRVQALEEASENSESGCVATLTKPFNALLNTLASKALEPGPSVLQTLTQAVDCLALIADHGNDRLLDPLLKPQALVVDDDPISGDVNVTALQHANFDTTCIEDPETALNILASTPFDLIVLDVNMPKMSGFEVCEKLRQLPQGKTTPVIFLTAFNNFENRKKSVLSGGGDFITKPVSTRELALKATIHLLKAQIRSAKNPNGTNPAQFIADPRTPSAAPRPLEASALLSPTESATSSVGNTEFLTVTPAMANPAAPHPSKDKPADPIPNGKTHRNGHLEVPPLRLAGHDTEPNDVKPSGAASEAASAEVLAKFEDERASLAKRAEAAEAQLKEIDAQFKKTTSELESVRGSIEKKNARAAELEKQFAELQAAHKELQSKLSTGENASAQSKGAIAALQATLQEKSTELKRLQTELDKASVEKSRLEGELLAQAEDAKAAAEKAEAAIKERDDSFRLLEDELVALRKVRDQLQQKQQQSAAELTRAKSDLAQQAAERARSDSELRAEFAAAKQAMNNVESSLKEKEESYRMLEEELIPLRKARDQFQQRQQQNLSEIERLKGELSRESTERAKSESELRAHISNAQESASKTASALKEATSRCGNLEAELKSVTLQREQLQKEHSQSLTNLKRVESDLQREIADRAKTEALLKKAHERAAELENALLAGQQKQDKLEKLHQQSISELERVQTKLANETADRAKAEAQLRQQLETANESAALAASAFKQATTQCQTLENDLKSSQQAFKQIQKQHQQSTADLERAHAEMAKENAARSKSEAQFQEQLKAANLKATQTEASLKEQEARSAALEKDLVSARKEHDQLGKRLDQTSATLKQTEAKLEKEAAQRAQLEADCKQLAAAKESLSAERAQLEKKLATAEAKNLETEQKLQASASALAQTTSDLEMERKKHHRTEQRAEALAGRLRGLHGELSKYLSEEPKSDSAE